MGTVVTYGAGEGLTEHEAAVRDAIAWSLAALKGVNFGGEYDAALQRYERFASPLYFVPSETLSGCGARVHFSGVDPQAGPLVRYTIVEPHETAH